MYDEYITINLARNYFYMEGNFRETRTSILQNSNDY